MDNRVNGFITMSYHEIEVEARLAFPDCWHFLRTRLNTNVMRGIWSRMIFLHMEYSDWEIDLNETSTGSPGPA